MVEPVILPWCIKVMIPQVVIDSTQPGARSSRSEGCRSSLNPYTHSTAKNRWKAEWILTNHYSRSADRANERIKPMD